MNLWRKFAHKSSIPMVTLDSTRESKSNCLICLSPQIVRFVTQQFIVSPPRTKNWGNLNYNFSDFANCAILIWNQTNSMLPFVLAFTKREYYCTFEKIGNVLVRTLETWRKVVERQKYSQKNLIDKEPPQPSLTPSTPPMLKANQGYICRSLTITYERAHNRSCNSNLSCMQATSISNTVSSPFLSTNQGYYLLQALP